MTDMRLVIPEPDWLEAFFVLAVKTKFMGGPCFRLTHHAGLQRTRPTKVESLVLSAV